MPLRLAVDPRPLVPYLAASLLGCGGGTIGPLVPVAAGPVERPVVQAWVDSLTPAERRLIRFKWSFEDAKSTAGGRGSARIAAPDSLRFDIRGPLGAGAAAAVVVGDSAQWAEPPDALRKIVPSYPLLWAMLGVPRRPAGGARLRGLELPTGGRVWQFVDGADTTEYLVQPGRFVAEVRNGDGVLGRVETKLAAGAVRSARLVVPSAPARLDITFDPGTRPDSFPAAVWREK